MTTSILMIPVIWFFSILLSMALTPSLQTVIELINDVRSDNDCRQKAMDASGVKLPRSLNFSDQSFTDPEYELVVLHLEHLLPGGGMPLTIYNRANNTYKQYVCDGAGLVRGVNIFLVALDAEIKFRRYYRMAQVPGQQLPDLPPHVIELMDHVIELVDLLYWQPAPAKGSKGEGILIHAEATSSKRKNPPRSAKSYIERSSSKENTGEDIPTQSKSLRGGGVRTLRREELTELQ
ncbi:hypothetical protein JOM56_009865 [Amanita muscaria]